MKQTQIVLGITVLELEVLLVVPGIQAAEPSEIDTNRNVIDGSVALGEDAVLSLSPLG
jgi:hypothetical protein